ncbi:zinc finger X-chromosomal protein-like isoform X1 [Rhodnius prolixus]|uniref:zinc finger X-chromosomal protein-like isoform X1 n=1 Tax=Rhodnius prolixus TaxID=13249 RepID=UPI003D18CA86
MELEKIGKKFGCLMCGKSYKYRAGLYNHRRYECGKEPQFYCHFCPYKCKQKSGLKTHLKTKHDSGRYLCHCGKSYKHKFSLNKHVKYECGKEPQFQCPYCSYRGKRKGAVKSHISRKHVKIPLSPSSTPASYHYNRHILQFN